MLKEHQKFIVSQLWRHADRAFRLYDINDNLILYPGVPRWYDVGRFLNKECEITHIKPEFIEARLAEEIETPKPEPMQKSYLNSMNTFEAGFLAGMAFAVAIIAVSVIMYFNFS